jgi:PAS domain S-box-containing protein
MNAAATVLLDATACVIIFFCIVLVSLRRKSIQLLDSSFILLLLAMAFFSLSNLLEWTSISNALDPYEDFLLPFMWSFWFFALLKKIQLIELERAHDELQISENRTRALLENLPQKIFLKDIHSEYLTCNKNFASDVEMVPEEIAGKTDYDFYPAEMAEKYRKDDHRILESGEAEEIEEKYFMNHREIWVHTVKTPVTDENGRAIGILGIFWDITERKKAEESIIRQNATLSGILEILDQTLTTVNDESLGSACLSVIEKITESEFGFIGETDKQKGILGFTAIRGRVWEACLLPDKSGHSLRSGEKLVIRGLIKEALDNKTGFFTNDPPAHPFATGIPDGHPELKNFLGVPLISADQTIGMIGLANRPGGYSTQEIEAVQAIAPVIVKSLTSKRAEKALRDSEENLRAYFNNLAVGTAQIDIKGHFVKVNNRFCGITGYSREELCGGMSPLDLDLPEERDIDFERITRFFKGEAPYNVEKRYVRKDGKIVWVHVTVATVRDDNNHIVFTAAVIEDITERKHAEEALKNSEERLRLAQQIARMGFWDVDMSSGELTTSEELVWIYGHNGIFPKTLKEFFDIVHPDDIPKIERLREEAMKDHHPFEYDFRIRRPSGEIRWIYNKGSAEFDAKGHPIRVFGINIDITERKRAEEALLANEERLRTILNSLADAVIATDTSGVVKSINPAAERLTGWRNGQALGKPMVEVFVIVDSDSGETVPDPISRVFHTGTMIGLASNTKLISRDGRKFHIADSAAPIRDVRGEITGVVLVFRDVTEEYGIREALRESEERYRLFYENSPFALLAVKSNILCNPNPSALKLYGISAKELKNTPPWELSPERQPDGCSSRDKAIYYIKEALAGRPQYFEWVHQRRDGSQFDAEVALTRIYLKGEPQITATVIDITDRKKALESLKASLHEKETLLQEIYHRTKNNMMVISSFLELQAASVENEEVDRIIHDSVTRIRTMSLAHEMLYKGRSLSRINMREYITDLGQLLSTGSGISPEQVRLQFDIEEIELLIDIAIPCGLIINELLSNCFKYAFPDQRKGFVAIGLSKIGEKQVEMSVKDNGVGLPEGFDIMQTDTLGVQLVTQIARHQLHATISVSSKNGLCWNIAFREDLYSERV